VLVAIGALRDGSKVVLALQSGHRESTASWSKLLRDLKQRGMTPPKRILGDGHLGLWGALANVFPEAGGAWRREHLARARVASRPSSTSR
jgi:putative transposase